MIDFIIKLEDMLKNSGIQDWEIEHIPQTGGYLLKIDDSVIYMKKLNGGAVND
jgi:hypothetical protein